MDNPLTRKLELFGPLSDEDKRLLDDVVYRPRSVNARTTLISEGDAPSSVHLIMSGLACRLKHLPNGDRHIFAYLVPGDLCDLHIFILREMDHTVETLSPCRIVDIPRDRVLELTRRPDISRALWWSNLVDEATLREWLVNLGSRDAPDRIAHLFCEIHLRMASVGLATDEGFALPITQGELGDTMGISSVHANRALQELRSRNLVDLRAGMITIPNLDRLRRMCGFDPNYLHLNGGKRDKREPAFI